MATGICTQCHRPGLFPLKSLISLVPDCNPFLTVSPSKHGTHGVHDCLLLRSLFCLHKSKRCIIDDSWHCQCDESLDHSNPSTSISTIEVEDPKPPPFVRIISSIPPQQIFTGRCLEPTVLPRSTVQVSLPAPLKPNIPPRPATRKLRSPAIARNRSTEGDDVSSSCPQRLKNPPSSFIPKGESSSSTTSTSTSATTAPTTATSIRSNKSVHFKPDCFIPGSSPSIGSGESICSFSGSLIEATATAHQRRTPHYMMARTARPMTTEYYSWAGPGNVLTLGGSGSGSGYGYGEGLEKRRSHYSLRSETESMVSFWEDGASEDQKKRKAVPRKLRRRSRSLLGGSAAAGASASASTGRRSVVGKSER